MNSDKKMTVTAHSGCMNTKPNSIESMEKGFEAGADIVEVDIRFASDGTPVLYHSLLSEKSEKDAVRLSQAFECMKKHPGKKVNLDIKETSHIKDIPSLAKKIGVSEQIFFTGVWPRFVRKVKKNCPGVTYYLNYNCISALKNFTPYIHYLVSRTKRAGAVGINMNKKGCGEKLVKMFHDAGLLVSVWTIRDSQEAEVYIKMKPDNITCINTDEVITLIRAD